jgi:hypothetical protein
VDHLLEEEGLDLADGTDFVKEGVEEAFELVFGACGDEEMSSAEAVFAGVLSGSCFAFFGFRAVLCCALARLRSSMDCDTWVSSLIGI